MKTVISVVGARPNYMKVAPIHRALVPYRDAVCHMVVHTGQHYSSSMSDAFFADLEMPEPAEMLGVGSGSHAEQTAAIMIRFEKVCLRHRPDLILVVGDVNSTVACVLTAAKCGIRTGHVEAGLRSYDRTMPEEINRVATDSICDYAFVSEQSGLDNLKREGFPTERAFFVGNTMIDSLHYALPAARRAGWAASMGLAPKSYVVVTLHRPSNVDEPEQLRGLLNILAGLSMRRTVLLPLHPRTRKNIEAFGLAPPDSPNFRIMEPLGYIRFLSLLLDADFVLTDSGGIQEETTVLGIPCITMRTSTERPVTCDLGTNRLVPPEPGPLQEAICDLFEKPRSNGTIPPLWDGHAAERIAKIILKI